MKINKTFKYRIYPTKEQEILFSKHFGCKRFVYNYFLNLRKTEYETNKKSLNYFDTAKLLTELKHTDDHNWLTEVNAQSIQAAIRDLDVAYNRMFKGLGGYPNFKRKFDKESFKVPQGIQYCESELWLPKFKEPIKVREDRPLTGKILFATVSKSKTNKYFVAITVETEQKLFKPNKNEVGIDLGLTTLATLSNGKTFENIRTTKKYEKELTYQQRQLSKKIKGSNNRNKQRIKVAKVHENIVNTRLNHLHQITTSIIRENQTICVEGLTVSNLIQNHCLAKGIADVSWGEFLRQLKYKSEWYGRELVSIDTFFPSTKMCRHCGHVNRTVELKDRSWDCPNCGKHINRDYNASINILNEGLKIFKNSGCGTQSEPKQKHVEALTIVKPLKHETHPSLAGG